MSDIDERHFHVVFYSQHDIGSATVTVKDFKWDRYNFNLLKSYISLNHLDYRNCVITNVIELIDENESIQKYGETK